MRMSSHFRKQSNTFGDYPIIFLLERCKSVPRSTDCGSIAPTPSELRLSQRAHKKRYPDGKQQDQESSIEGLLVDSVLRFDTHIEADESE